jgi:hypothetical protein
MGWKAWTAKEQQLAAWWRSQDVKCAAIARRLGRTVGGVRQKFVRMRVVVHPEVRGRRGKGELLRAVRRVAHLPVSEAAWQLNVEPSAVSRARRKLGLPRSTRAENAKRAWVTRRVSRGRTQPVE